MCVKCVCFALVIASIIILAKAWRATEKNVENPLHPGKCYNAEFQMYIRLDKTVGSFERNDERFCQKMTCSKGEDGELYIEHVGCTFVYPEDNCKIVKGHRSLPFPLCCSHLKCSEKVTDTISVDYNWIFDHCTF